MIRGMNGTDPRSDRRDPDEIALERYRYLLRTAPPDAIEAAHAEAFAALSPEQRRKVLEGLAREIPESELREAQATGDDPTALARVATRAEMLKPGTIERAYGGMPARGGLLGGIGFGGSFLSMLAGAFVGTSIANALFMDHGYPPGDPESSDAASDAGGESGSDSDVGSDDSDVGGGFGGDFGGDAGSDI
jgi:hypothetical protein